MAADPNVPAGYTPPPDALIGQVLAGRYLIQKKLGEGGMGSVYLATHTVLEKQVALKVLHGEYARKPDLVERFMQEAKAASRIRHENVIDVSDFGSTPDGLVFFAMELLRGHDLHDEIARARLAGKRLPWEKTRPIFLQVCSALSAAHAQGIVHRDLKPENIYLVEWLGHSDFVKLLDFGIAKLTEVDEGGRKLTKTGMLFGTPEYMSPEQARGEPVDHRVDVYAMGCILFQMVTGRVPFEAENFMGILSLHLTEQPPPIGAPILNEIGAPLGLEPIIMRALEKNRDRRWQTIDEMANAIRALHGEAAVQNQPPTVPRAATGPARTVWTGTANLATITDEAPPPRKQGSKLPWVLLAVVLAGGAAAAGYFATRGSSSDAPKSSPAPVATITPDAAPSPAPVPPPKPPSLPASQPPSRVHLKFTSTPAGADVFDVAAGHSLGPTPMEMDVDKATAAHDYRISKEGYVAQVVSVTPDKDQPLVIDAKLVAVAGTGTKVKIKKTGTGTGTASGSDTGPVTTPDAGHPKKPPDSGCTEEPCIKNPFGG